MQRPADLLADLAQFADDQVPILETALALGALRRSNADAVGARAAITLLADNVLDLTGTGADMEAIAQAMVTILCKMPGFALGGESADGNELSELLEERRGARETLAILWLAVAEDAHLPAEMLTFPLQSLIRLCDDTGKRAIVDCSDGRLLHAPALRTMHKLDSGPNAELDPTFFQPLSRRDALLRWRQSLKMRHLRLGQLDQALEVVEGALLFSPRRAGLWREVGLMRLRLDDLPGAAAALEQFVQREDNALARGKGKQLLAEVRSRMR